MEYSDACVMIICNGDIHHFELHGMIEFSRENYDTYTNTSTAEIQAHEDTHTHVNSYPLYIYLHVDTKQ